MTSTDTAEPVLASLESSVTRIEDPLTGEWVEHRTSVDWDGISKLKSGIFYHFNTVDEARQAFEISGMDYMLDVLEKRQSSFGYPAEKKNGQLEINSIKVEFTPCGLKEDSVVGKQKGVDGAALAGLWGWWCTCEVENWVDNSIFDGVARSVDDAWCRSLNKVYMMTVFRDDLQVWHTHDGPTSYCGLFGYVHSHNRVGCSTISALTQIWVEIFPHEYDYYWDASAWGTCK